MISIFVLCRKVEEKGMSYSHKRHVIARKEPGESANGALYVPLFDDI